MADLSEKAIHNMGSIMFDKLNSMEVNFSDINFNVDQFPLISVFLFSFRENNSSKSFERVSNYQRLKQNTSDFCLVFLNITTKILINILSFGQLWNTLSVETSWGKAF